MCYQESRWHAICNHTIKSKVECPKQCLKYGAVDTVETQLTAYCHACRRHVDNLGVAPHYRNAANRLSSRRSRPANLALASSTSVENLHAATASPASSMRRVSQAAKAGIGSSLSKRLTSTVSMGDLRGEIASGKQPSMGMIMKGLMQEQQEQEKERVEDVRVFMNVIEAPELQSPIPQKPHSSTRIPEEAVSECDSAMYPTANSTTSDGLRSLQAVLSRGTVSKSLKGSSAQCASLTAPTTPRTPSRSSFIAFLEHSPSKSLMEPLPSLPLPPHSSKSTTFGFTLSNLRKGHRKTRSSPRLLGDRSPYLLQRKNSPTEAMPSLPLQSSKSSRTLGSNTKSNTTVSSFRTDREWSETPPSPLMMMAGPRPMVRAANPSKPAENKDLIGFDDPQWLEKHGLKWDAHGLAVVSVTV